MSEINRLSDELVQILRSKRQNMLSILNFTQLQTNAIEEQNDGKLGEYIEQKQELIDSINLLNENFVNKLNLIKGKLGINSLDEVADADKEIFKQVRFEIEGINMLVNQISVIEKENNTKIKKEYDDNKKEYDKIKSKQKEISNGKKAASAYVKKPSQTGGVFIDSKN